MIGPINAKTTSLKQGSKDTGVDLSSAFPAPRSVRALQGHLKKIGVIGSGEVMQAGTFDAATARAVRRLQWYASNVPGALDAGGAYQTRSITPLTIDGIVGPGTWALLDELIRGRFAVTGRLTTINFPSLMHIYPNAGFVTLVPALGPVGLADTDFATAVAAMNIKAERLGIYLFVNQLFRVEGATVSGAVVPPASYSAHKLGRAIDLQLGTKSRIGFGNPPLSTEMAKAPINTPFGSFREYLKSELRCRYGGDFKDIDRPHFDQQILPAGNEEWKHYYFFNQLHFHQIAKNVQALPKMPVQTGDWDGKRGSGIA